VAAAIDRLKRLLPTRATHVSVAIAFVYCACIGFVPLFGTIGYEYALAVGLVVPSIAAIWTALDASADAEITPAGAVWKGVGNALVLDALALVVSLAHTLRSGACDPLGGLRYYALTAGAGVLIGGLWGALVAEVARRAKRRRLVAVLLALAGPLSSIAIGVWRFASSPMIFAYDPFVGYFSGTLYDTIIEPGTALYTYRLGSLATLLAALFIAPGIERDGSIYVIGSRARASLALGVVFFVASLGVTAFGEKLGHHSTSKSIEETLGARKNGTRCDVVFPSTVAVEGAGLLLRDCEEEIASAEQFFGARGPEKITAFFFRDAEQKRALMGAEHTYIAKPWRHEVYLQLGEYPHPVLGHEIAHVVAGAFGNGPFHVAGSAGGLIPNPGLIEGAAVAASPDDDVLTDDEWARAMKDAKILPPMRSVFSLEFLGASSAKSYTLAGSFIRFLIATRGKEVMRAWYGGGDIEALTHASWADLERDYFAFLDRIVLPPEAVRVAEARFGRPGLFSRRCPHAVDEIRRDADRCRDTHDFARATELYEKALALDSDDFQSRYARAQMLARYTTDPAGLHDLEAFAVDEHVPSIYRDRAEEALGDIDLLVDKPGAADHYARAHARVVDEDFLRTLDVKSLAASDPELRRVVVPMLIGDATRAPDAWVFGLAMGRAKADQPVVRYLIARNFATRSRCPEALVEFDGMRASGPMPLATVTREAFRLEAVCACTQNDEAKIARMRTEAASVLLGGRRDSVVRMLDRCRR
jgi:hypothetical protein